MLKVIADHNRIKESQSKEIPKCDLKESLITQVLFPVYFPNSSVSTKSKTPEALKFGHQVAVAISSFSQWLSATKKGNAANASKTQCQSGSSIEKKLRKGIKSFCKRKQTQFTHYLASGDLANRGLMDKEEIGWLVEACAFEGDKNSPFSHSRRLQRLSHVTLAALLSNKHFQTGDHFQLQLRNALVSNRYCLDWLVKAASSGGVSFCPIVSLSDFGKLSRLTRGSTCTIYRANWNEEDVVIKLFNEEEKSAHIRHEIALLSLLRHSNLLPVYAYGTSMYENSQRMFCISPLAERGSLYHVLRDKSAKFDQQRRMDVLRQTAAGVEHLHSLNLIHRDLKSLNILIRENWSVWVADIGATRVQTELMTVNVGTPSGWLLRCSHHNSTLKRRTYTASECSSTR